VKTVFLITARMKSTRLPRKALADIAGRTAIGHLIDRLRRARRIDEIVICTSVHPQDDALVEAAAAEGVACFRGDEDDVLLRLHEAARRHGAEYVLNVTADCPLVDPAYADRIVHAYEQTGADLIRALDLPHGAFCYGLRPEALAQAVAIKDTNRTEVWGRYFTDTDLFLVYDLPIDPAHRRPDVRMTLDYPEDLALLQAVCTGAAALDPSLGLDAVLQYLDAHPQVAALNRDRAVEWRRQFSSQSAVVLKPRYPVARAVVVGAGSIGQRHIRNLRTLGITDVVALRTRLGHSQGLDPALGVREVTTWDGVADARPDIGFVCNPTSEHLDTIRRLIPHVRGLFIEKPLAASLDDIDSAIEQIDDRRIVSFVGHNLSFHPAVRAMWQQLGDGSLGAPTALQCQAGHWLPDWHPDEDFRRAYFARADLAGGVLRTLVHEIQLACDTLGHPVEVSCLLTPNAALPLDVEVMADLSVRHAGGSVSQLHLDFVQRGLHRVGVLSCERGWVRYDLVNGEVAAQRAGEGQPRLLWSDPSFDWNRTYLDELSTFLQFVREGRVRHPQDVWHARSGIAVIDAAFQSAAAGRTVSIASTPSPRARCTMSRSA
jgi:spore coat polysaccharide biosynthesis protein SpsF